MVKTRELWSIGNLASTFKEHGLPQDRGACAALAGIKVSEDKALSQLRWALSFADLGFDREAREGILAALETDPAVFERAPEPAECWLLCARAFATSDAARALEAFRRASSINPAVASRIDPRWPLAGLLNEQG
jgi:hypothetical protein